jgi:hypothetical protein
MAISQEHAMSIEFFFDDVRGAARHALDQANAISACPNHSAVTIRRWDKSAELEAVAIATAMTPCGQARWSSDDIRAALKEELGAAADFECPICNGLRYL